MYRFIAFTVLTILSGDPIYWCIDPLFPVVHRPIAPTDVTILSIRFIDPTIHCSYWSNYPVDRIYRSNDSLLQFHWSNYSFDLICRSIYLLICLSIHVKWSTDWRLLVLVQSVIFHPSLEVALPPFNRPLPIIFVIPDQVELPTSSTICYRISDKSPYHPALSYVCDDLRCVLRISNEGDDRMGAKIKTPKNP